MGTVHFMAPEMVHPHGAQNLFQVGIAADIWSMGITLYLVLYGNYPKKHMAKSVSGILLRIKSVESRIEFPADFPRWIISTHKSARLKSLCANLILVT